MLGDWIRKLTGARPRVEEVEAELPRWKPDATWHPWQYAGQNGTPIPYSHKLVRMMRANWDKPLIRSPYGLQPEANVAGLYWQPFEGGIIDGEWVPASPLQVLRPPAQPPTTIPTSSASST